MTFCLQSYDFFCTFASEKRKNMKFWRKKEKEGYPRSFAKRLTWRIMLMQLIVMGGISLLIFLSAMLAITVSYELFIPQVIATKAESVGNKLSEVSVAAINTVPDIEASIDQPDKMYDIMERLIKLNPQVRSSGISFIDNYYPKKGRRYCPYAVRKDSAGIERQTLGDEADDYLTAEWFTETIAADSARWSKPFFSGNDSTDTPLVAYLVPIHDKAGKAVAVLGVDFLLDGFLSDAFKGSKADKDTAQWSSKWEAYAFAIDNTGIYLSHPDHKRVINENFLTRCEATPDTMDNYVAKTMTDVDQKSTRFDNIYELNLDGEDVTMFYNQIDNTKWTVAIVIPTLFLDLAGYIFGGFLLFFILIGMIVVFFAGRRGIKKTSKPLKQLAASADEVAKGNFMAPLPDIQSRDEIHLLRDSFENMQHSLSKYTEELRTTTAQKASMESELKVAHDIQMSMLPKVFPPYPDRQDIDIFGSLVPAKGVGGDLFDFFIRDEKLFFCVGDVSGKGVPASLFMAVTRSLFRNIATHVAVPSEIMRTLNNAMTEGNDTNMFVTVFIGVLDLPTGMLRYCNAGHDAPLLVGRDVGTLPCDPNLPIGVIANFNYSQQEADIDSQTTIFLYTDGLNEAENNLHEQFGDMRIWNVAKRLLGEHNHQPQQFISEMSAAVHRFVGNAEQSDDLTMLAIQYKG